MLLNQQTDSGETCFDCGWGGASWASLSHAIYLCHNCSAQHREMGSHISVVRSTTIENWSLLQLQIMKLGGNQKFYDYLSSYRLENASVPKTYYSKAAEYYREQLKCRATGQSYTFTPPSIAEGQELHTWPVGGGKGWWGTALNAIGKAGEYVYHSSSSFVGKVVRPDSIKDFGKWSLKALGACTQQGTGERGRGDAENPFARNFCDNLYERIQSAGEYEPPQTAQRVNAPALYTPVQKSAALSGGKRRSQAHHPLIDLLTGD